MKISYCTKSSFASNGEENGRPWVEGRWCLYVKKPQATAEMPQRIESDLSAAQQLSIESVRIGFPKFQKYMIYIAENIHNSKNM